MATVKRFEELIVWQMAERQCAAFYEIVKCGRFNHNFALQDQMDRSSGSVMDNIAEGFDRYTKAEFRQFLIVARGSNAEFRSQLYRARNRGIIELPEFEKLKLEAEQLGVKIHHFINYLTQSNHKHKPSAGYPYEREKNDSTMVGEPVVNMTVLETDESAWQIKIDKDFFAPAS